MENRIETADGGYVELLTHMGCDRSIANSARVCTLSEDKGDAAADRKLLRYMLRHGHTSPFEMGIMQFRVHVPLDVWRQWIRHRTASVNEVSSRYTEIEGKYCSTSADSWRIQSKSNRQGSEGVLDMSVGAELTKDERELLLHADAVYRRRLKAGVAREQARKDLPLSTYTTAVWSINLHNLMNFLRQRMHPHAQQEIREYAGAVYELASRAFPVSMEAFSEYVLGAVTFSERDLRVLRSLFAEKGCVLDPSVRDSYDTDREYRELVEKLEKAGVTLDGGSCEAGTEVQA